MSRTLLAFILLLGLTFAATADDGSRLWLRFPDASQPSASVSLTTEGEFRLAPTDQAVVATALSELRHHWQGLPLSLRLTASSARLAPGGFRIIKVEEESFRITASSAAGLLYAAYFVLRAQTMGDGCLCQALGPNHDLTEEPDRATRAVSLGDASLLNGRLSLFAQAMASAGINELQLPAASATTVASLRDTLSSYAISVRFGKPQCPTLPLTADPNWTGDHLQQFEVYAAARSQWQASLTRERMVCEWLAQTFSDNPFFIISMRDALLSDPAERIFRLFETWQEMQPYIDKQRFEEVEQHLIAHLDDEN